jgi:hypothetical protein
MKIEEVIKIYEFLENLDFIGFFALCVLLSIGIYAVFVPLKVKRNVTLIVLVLLNGALGLLYYEAKGKIPDLHAANFIKQDFITSSYKQKSFKNIDLPETTDTIEKIRILKRLVEKFPEEFLLVKLYVLKDSTIKLPNKKNSVLKVSVRSPVDNMNNTAIRIIDTKAIDKIDKQINDKANRTAHLLASYLFANNKDSILVNDDPKKPSLQIIDNDGWLIGPEFFKALVGRNDLQPFYDNSHNIISFSIPKGVKAFAVKGTITY